MPHADLGDLSICYTTAGPEDGPAVLLVSGLGSQLITWPPELVGPLAAAGARVIAYDNRDVGESTWFDHVPPVDLSEVVGALQAGTPMPPPYTLGDMAADAIAVLDHLGVDRAHVVGVSMGGMVAQRIAIHHPDRVASLTSIMSTTSDPGLPAATPEATAALLAPTPPDRDGYIEAVLARRRVFGSPGLERDEAFVRSTVEASYDRGLNPDGFLRHYHAVLAEADRTAELQALDLPAVVIHGAADPLVRPASGRATAAAIPGAELVVVEGMGHDLPPAACARIVEQVRALAGV
jgi:pimeloyl-ACP methyl ester carboxylesterase